MTMMTSPPLQWETIPERKYTFREWLWRDDVAKARINQVFDSEESWARALYNSPLPLDAETPAAVLQELYPALDQEQRAAVTAVFRDLVPEYVAYCMTGRLRFVIEVIGQSGSGGTGMSKGVDPCPLISTGTP